MCQKRNIGLAGLLILLNQIMLIAQTTIGQDQNNNRNSSAQTNRNNSSATGRINQSGRPVAPVVSQNRVQVTLLLNREPLTVSGNGNDVFVRGNCSRLTVSGSENIVHIESVGAIIVSGNHNEVVWRTGNPSVNNMGTANNIISRD